MERSFPAVGVKWYQSCDVWCPHGKGSGPACYIQSLEFIAEMRILAEMKIENRGNKSYLGGGGGGGNQQAYFSSLNVTMMNL